MSSTDTALENPSAVRMSIRNKAIFYTCCLGVPAFVGVAWSSWQLGNWPVWIANISGIGMAVLTGYWASRPNPPRWFTYPVLVFLMLFFWYLIFSGYAGGVGVIWMMLLPPLALLLTGRSIIGLSLITIQIPVLLAGFFVTDAISETVLSTPIRARLLVVYMVTAMCCFAYAWAAELYEESLRLAQARIHTLEQMLPMCAYCKNVRDDDTWGSIEEYLLRNGDLQVSHSICPACVTKHFPD